jgi:predicted dithiol-disulfide oxidoreductase (DUF899 family)
MSYSGPRRKPPARSTYSPFSDDCGAGGGFLLSVFLRDGEDVYRTYYTTARGLDQNAFVTGIFDLTVNGRQEDWEDSPPGWPQKRHIHHSGNHAVAQRSHGLWRFR